MENHADSDDVSSAAWASEKSRASVVVWDADALDDLSLAKPIYTCSTEVDPRRPLWRRALSAIRSPEYTQPIDVPQAPASMVIVVERATGGLGDAVPEAGFVCHLRGRVLEMTVHANDGAEVVSELELDTDRPSVLDVADALFTLLAELNRSAGFTDDKVRAEKRHVTRLETTVSQRKQKG
ncbi:hypothetical protein [Caballeronia fortuita]|nr:hypothetical protein [Caballeronia fortuita]